MTEVAELVDELQTLRHDLDGLQGDLRRRGMIRSGSEWRQTNSGGWLDFYFDPAYPNAIDVGVVSVSPATPGYVLGYFVQTQNVSGMILYIWVVWKDGSGNARGPDPLGEQWVRVDYWARGH